MIKAAIFDVFGTVVDWRTGVATAAGRIFREKAITVDPTAFADAWRAEYQPGMETVRSGNRGYVPLDDLHFENLARILPRFGLEGRLTETELWDLNAVWEQLPPWPDAVPALTALQRRMIIGTCSNGSVALMARLARFGGLPWDCLLGADVARTYKPEPEAYLASAAALRLAPEEVIMVAAHNADLAAAAGHGLKTAFVPRPDEYGPGTGEVEATGDWTITAADFPDLARELGA